MPLSAWDFPILGADHRANWAADSTDPVAATDFVAADSIGSAAATGFADSIVPAVATGFADSIVPAVAGSTVPAAATGFAGSIELVAGTDPIDFAEVGPIDRPLVAIADRNQRYQRGRAEFGIERIKRHLAGRRSGRPADRYFGIEGMSEA